MDSDPDSDSIRPTNTPLQEVIDYYDIATIDYSAWSRNFNMHFGYCKTFANIFSLERMLINMNDVVLDNLAINPSAPAHICDLGCGMGTVSRYGAQKYPHAFFKGVSISPYQVKQGNRCVAADGLDRRVELLRQDFEHLDFPNDTFDHAYALESSCHASGPGKSKFINELARILKSNGTFCIVDGFIQHQRHLPRTFNFLYSRIKKYWALPCFATLDLFQQNLKSAGLSQIQVREIGWRVAPSVAYIPFTCLKFFARELLKHRNFHLQKERWHNVFAPLLGMMMGLFRNHFGYYLITGKKT